MPLLTKSKYLLGLQCPKLLWVAFNDKDKIPKPDVAKQHVFDEGHLVGELARRLFPTGVLIEAEPFGENVRKTNELIPKRRPLFETGFKPGDLFSRADILNPVGKGEWDIIEVKSSTRVKDINLHDLSFQKYCYEQGGVKIRKCFLMHINKEYVKEGNIDPKTFFNSEDVTSEVQELASDIKERVDGMFKIIGRKECPAIGINAHCFDPYECPLADDCWNHLPDNSVFDLYYGGKKSFELYENGVHAIIDIPDDFKLNDKQSIQKECARTGKPHINKEGINKFLKALKYPLHYLDFETFMTAVPLYDGLRPYQQVLFQFSLHIVKKEGEKSEHYSFLADAKGDPRKEFAAKLKEALGDKGSIIIFNKSFEPVRMRELAEAFPEYSKWAKAAISRMADLMELFRNFDYYNPKQKGSCSMKDILPAMTGKSYDELEISDGTDASLAYLGLMAGKVNKEEEENIIRKNLEKYCCLDTEGMMWIVEELGRL